MLLAAPEVRLLLSFCRHRLWVKGLGFRVVCRLVEELATPWPTPRAWEGKSRKSLKDHAAVEFRACQDASACAAISEAWQRQEFVHVFVCVWMFIHTYTHTHMLHYYIYIYIVYIYIVCIYIDISVYMYIHTLICLFLYMYVCDCIHTLHKDFA